MTTNTKAFNDDLLKYYPYFLMFGLYIVLYLPCLTNYSISIDDENAFWRTDPTPWLSQGRIIGFFIEKFLIKQPTVIFFNEFFFGICCCLAYVLILRAFGRSKIGIFDIFSFGIFCAFPVWYFIFEFYANMPAVSIGILSCGTGIFFVSKVTDQLRISYVIYSILCFFISISSYQAFLYYIVVSIIALFIFKNNMLYFEKIKKLIYIFLILISSVLLYFSVLKILLITYKVEVSYIQNFANFGLFLNNTREQISKVLYDIYHLFVYNEENFIIYMPGVAIAVVLYFLLLLRKKRIFDVLLSLIMLIIPFIMHLVAYDWPLRAQMAASFVIWFFTFYFYYNSNYIGKTTCFVVMCLTLIQSAYVISYNTSLQKLAYQYDVALAAQITERIVEISGDPESQLLIDVYGSIPFKTNLRTVQSSTSGASFFEWDGGTTFRITGFMETIGYINIQPLRDDTNRARYFIEYSKMPSWPARGSVKRIDDVVLVKLSDDPNTKYQNMGELKSGNVVPVAEYNNKDILSKSYETYGIRSNESGYLTSFGDDSQIVLKFDSKAAKDCRILQIKADLTVEKSTMYQIYYLKRSKQQFSEKGSQFQYLNSGHNSVTMTISSEKGFENILRIDPVNNIQKFKFDRVSVSCVE